MLTAKLHSILTEHLVLLNRSSEIGILKPDSEGAVRVDLGVVDEGVPCLVAVFEGWLGGEEVADFYGLCSAVSQIVNLLADTLMVGFEFVVSVFELVVAAVVVVGVVGCGCCGGDELVHQRDSFFDPLP